MSTLSMLKIRAFIYVSTLALALVPSALPAQTAAPRTLVTVPFAFQVGSTHFAAGTYILSNPGEFLLSIQGKTRSALTMSSHESSKTPAPASKVVFYRYGDQYFLREVWMKGNIDHTYCLPSKAEEAVERRQSDNERASVPDHTNVEIALSEIPR